MKIELFDFAKVIGAHIDFSGSFGDQNHHVNADLVKGWSDRPNPSCYGRSDKCDLDEALADLAAELTARQTIRFGSETYTVPPLKHTTGYRGKRIKKKPATRAIA